MVNKIVLLLSMTLNLVLALIVFQNNRPVKALDFRDALADTPAARPSLNNSLAGVTPLPATPAVAAPVPAVAMPAPAAVAPAAVLPPPAIPAPAQATTAVSGTVPETAAGPAQAVPIKTAALIIAGDNDWKAYKQDAAEDGDVFISNIFRSRKRGEKAMAAAVRRTKARGKDILFSCVLTEKSGGVFYIIRMAPPAVHPPQVAAAHPRKSAQPYSTDLGEITSKAETEIQVMY
jgi:hypothetical protein